MLRALLRAPARSLRLRGGGGGGHGHAGHEESARLFGEPVRRVVLEVSVQKRDCVSCRPFISQPSLVCICCPLVQALAPGASRVWADWEAPHYALLAGTALIVLAAQFQPSSNPREWARDEAEERERRRAVSGKFF